MTRTSSSNLLVTSSILKQSVCHEDSDSRLRSTPQRAVIPCWANLNVSWQVEFSRVGLMTIWRWWRIPYTRTRANRPQKRDVVTFSRITSRFQFVVYHLTSWMIRELNNMQVTEKECQWFETWGPTTLALLPRLTSNFPRYKKQWKKRRDWP